MKKMISKVLVLTLSVVMLFSVLAAFTASAGESKVERDIYLVLDTSGSMLGNHIKRLKDAAKDFCAIVLSEQAADTRVAIITYGGEVKTYSFSSDLEALNGIIDGLSAKGDTYMYDGLNAVNTLNAAEGRPGAKKYVVVMADGIPNKGPEADEGKYTSSDSLLYYKYGNSIYALAESMWPEYTIYTVGFFPCDWCTGPILAYGKVLLKDIANGRYFEAYDADGMKDAFKVIAEDITGDNKPTDPTTKAPDPETTTKALDPDTTTAPTPPTTKVDPVTTTKAPEPTSAKPVIPQTGSSAAAIAVVAVALLAGAGVVATKKREQ